MKIESIKKIEAYEIKTDEDPEDSLGRWDSYLRISKDEWWEIMGSSYESVWSPEIEELEKLFQKQICQEKKK